MSYYSGVTVKLLCASNGQWRPFDSNLQIHSVAFPLGRKRLIRQRRPHQQSQVC